MWAALRRFQTALVTCALLFGLVAGAEAKKPSKKKRAPAKSKPARTAAAASAAKAANAGKIATPFTTVVIDAGHGGHDPGGIPQNIIPEKDVALDVAVRLQKQLEAAGLHTVMTRADDTFISLGERVRIADAETDAVFLSVHFNSALREAARGIETFYGSPSSAPLAESIHRSLLPVTENPEHRGVKHATFWVLRKTKQRAVLVECGFLTNPDDACVALDDGHRQLLAARIATAVLEYRNSLGAE
jgi:N-acetylmuramoyl-L-alanine amidase